MAGLDPHHPAARPGVEPEGDGERPLRAQLVGQGAEGGVVPCQPAVPGPGQADHPAPLAFPEGGDGRGQLGVGLEGLAGVDGPAGHELEQISAEQEDARPVPGVDGRRQVAGGRRRGRRRVLVQQQIADDQHPPAHGDVDFDQVGRGPRRGCPCHRVSSARSFAGSQLVG